MRDTNLFDLHELSIYFLSYSRVQILYCTRWRSSMRCCIAPELLLVTRMSSTYTNKMVISWVWHRTNREESNWEEGKPSSKRISPYLSTLWQYGISSQSIPRRDLKTNNTPFISRLSLSNNLLTSAWLTRLSVNTYTTKPVNVCTKLAAISISCFYSGYLGYPDAYTDAYLYVTNLDHAYFES